MLNVALGGTLRQHVDGHMERDRYNLDVHEVRVDTGRVSAGIVGRDGAARTRCTTRHSTALGGSVRAVAWAPDGTVEAIEVDGAPNVLGVQWHPELLRHRAEHLALFRQLAP